MKPTTPSVFASPVRPQTSRSRMNTSGTGFATQSLTFQNDIKLKSGNLSAAETLRTGLQNPSGSILKSTALRAAGAHRPCLPAAQEGQTKSLPGSAGGSLKIVWGCRLFFLLLLSLLSGWVYAGNNNQELTRKHAANPTAKAQLTRDKFVQQLTVRRYDELIDLGQITTDKAVQTLTGTTAASANVTQLLAATCESTGDNLAPAMVAIKSGQFQMGSPATESGRDTNEDQHSVTIPRPFAISRCEITVGQFRQFIKETGYKTTAEPPGKGCYKWNAEKKEWEQQADSRWDSPGFAQTDSHPVVCVSWHDAQRYIDWLSQRTGTFYHLPTEAEWEYAAHSGTVTPRFYVDNTQCDYANGLGQEAKTIADKDWVLADCRDNSVYTAPVASFAENQFGLFDMLGNALEWTLDCYHDSYKNAPADGSAWLESDGGECNSRVVRGGSWSDGPQYLRSASRSRNFTDVASDTLGFRVARAL